MYDNLEFKNLVEDLIQRVAKIEKQLGEFEIVQRGSLDWNWIMSVGLRVDMEFGQLFEKVESMQKRINEITAIAADEEAAGPRTIVPVWDDTSTRLMELERIHGPHHPHALDVGSNVNTEFGELQKRVARIEDTLYSIPADPRPADAYSPQDEDDEPTEGK